MRSPKRLTLLTFTGGGLAPALNPTLYGVIAEAQRRRFRVLGGLYGWVSLGRNSRIVDLTKMDVRSIRERGGTLLRSSRTNPLKDSNGLALVREVLRQRQVDAVVAIGGNDTLGAAAKLAKAGVMVVGVPKTIDNDLEATYWTPGFPTAAKFMADFVREIRDDAAYSLSRIFLIEAPGRVAGWLAAAAAFGGADVIVPPERPVRLKHFLRMLYQRYEGNGNFAVAVIAEHARFDDRRVQAKTSDQRDDYGMTRYNFITASLRDVVKTELGIDTKAAVPANWLESGEPTKVDRDLGEALGRHAVQRVIDGKSGRMTSIARRGRRLLVTDVPLSRAVRRERLLDSTYFDFEKFRPTKKFLDYLAPAFPSEYRTVDRAYQQLVQRVNRTRT